MLFSLLLSLEEELYEMTLEDMKLNDKIKKGFEKVKLRFDSVDLYDNLILHGDLRKQFEFESLNEA